MRKSVYKLYLKGTLTPAQGMNTPSVEYEIAAPYTLKST